MKAIASKSSLMQSNKLRRKWPRKTKKVSCVLPLLALLCGIGGLFCVQLYSLFTTGALHHHPQSVSCAGSAWAKKNAQAFVKSANDGLKAGLKKVKDHNKEKAEKKAAKKQQSDTKALTTSAPTASAPTKISKPAVDPLDAAFERPYVAEPQVPKVITVFCLSPVI